MRTKIALGCLEAGQTIAYATESVWGLGCNPWHEDAVQRLLNLKHRQRRQGLILVAAEISQFSFLLDGLKVSEKAQLELSWPGPTSWLVPHFGRVPDWICGDHDTVALRVSTHPSIRDLCLAWGGPLVSTSANVSGTQPATEIHQLRRYFSGQLACVFPGRPGARKRPSRIVDLKSGCVIRSD